MQCRHKALRNTKIVRYESERRERKMRERERWRERERPEVRREREKVPDRADLDFAGVGNAPMDFTGVLQSRLLARLLAIYTSGSSNSGT
jgi:hypothetical protein